MAVTTAFQGTTVQLTGEFFSAGAVVDPATVTVAINGPDSSVILPATSTGITHLAVGVYTYQWTVPAAALLGDYVITWTGTTPALTVNALVNVQSSNMNTWCTATDVYTATGVQVTQSLLVQAGYNIDIACGRAYTVDNTRVGSRDLYFLKLATCYQAAWLNEQPDAFARIDALGVSQGRSHTQLRDSALILAPHARKALKRVSWLKTRSLHVKSPFTDGMGSYGLDPLSSAADWIGPWTPVE